MNAMKVYNSIKFLDPTLVTNNKNQSHKHDVEIYMSWANLRYTDTQGTRII